MQLHKFEQIIFHRHKKFVYFMCFYITASVVTLGAWMQHKLFFQSCGYKNNFTYYEDVLNRVVVPADEKCRFYTDGLDAVNASNTSALHIVSNLSTVIQQCTYSFTSVWR